MTPPSSLPTTSPTAPTTRQPAAATAEAALVDPRTGLVTRLVPHTRRPGMPWAWTGCAAHVARTRAFTTWAADPFGYGAALGDPARARAAALGEAVERYCGNQVPDDLTTASYDDLREQGRAAIDPARLALHSPAQYAAPGFPFVPFGRDLPVAWVAGTRLDPDRLDLDRLDQDGHEPVLAPASLVYLDYYTGPRTAQPPTNALQYAGIAAGPTPADAARSGLEELLERDATALWWPTGAQATRITGAQEVVGRLDDPESDTRTVRLWLLPSPVGVPVVAAFVEDHARRIVAFGTACRADPVAAATKAVVEAFAVLAITMDLVDPGSDTWRAIAAGDIPPHLYRPLRADRSYRDAFAPDWRDLTDLPPVAQLYLDPRMHGQPLDRLRDDAAPAVDLADIPAVPAVGGTAEELCGEYLRRLRAAGMDAVGVDVTTRDVRAAGLHVLRVVVPGLLNNAAAAFPLLGGERLYRVPVEQGWLPGPVTEDTLLRHPVPLA